MQEVLLEFCVCVYFYKATPPFLSQQFSLDQAVSSETAGYVKRPSLKDKIHCVVFVVDASKILTYPKGLTTTLQQLREHISDLGEQTANRKSTTDICARRICNIVPEIFHIRSIIVF